MKKKVIIIIVAIILIVGLIFVGFNIFNPKNETFKKIFHKETYAEYHKGDVINFKDQEWYVLYDSDKNTDYVTLLSADILYLADEGIENVFNEVYEISPLNKYLEGDYVKQLGSDNLVEIHGYKARLLNMDDLKNTVSYDYDEDEDEYTLTDCPDYICLPEVTYATMIDTADKEFVDVYTNVNDIEDPIFGDYTLHLKYYNLTSTFETAKLESLVDDASIIVRPVINVYKKSLS